MAADGSRSAPDRTGPLLRLHTPGDALIDLIPSAGLCSWSIEGFLYLVGAGTRGPSIDQGSTAQRSDLSTTRHVYGQRGRHHLDPCVICQGRVRPIVYRHDFQRK